jgi:hypothetical protein
MPDRFDLPNEQVRFVQVQVYREQVAWLVLIAALMAFAPLTRFGPSWHFLTRWEDGPRAFAAVFLAAAAALATGIWRASERLMGWSLFVGGITIWTLGIFLAAGAVTGSTGLLGGAMCLYPGRHMLIHSALFASQRKRRRS